MKKSFSHGGTPPLAPAGGARRGVPDLLSKSRRYQGRAQRSFFGILDELYDPYRDGSDFIPRPRAIRQAEQYGGCRVCDQFFTAGCSDCGVWEKEGITRIAIYLFCIFAFMHFQNLFRCFLIERPGQQKSLTQMAGEFF